MKNWLKITIKFIISIILFGVGFFLSAGLTCIGGTKYLCGSWYLNFIAYFLLWPVLLSQIFFAELFGKSILGLFGIIFFVIVNILWIYLIIHTIGWILNKFKA